MSGERRWFASGKRNPCPVCGRTKDGDCRTSGDGLEAICHHPKELRRGDVVKGHGDGNAWAFTGNTSDGRAGHFTVHKPRQGQPQQFEEFNPSADADESEDAPHAVQPAPLPAEPPRLALLDPPRPAGGSPYAYTKTQRVNRAPLPDGGKRFYCQHLAGDRWIDGAGPDQWPVFNHADTFDAVGWILETEGEKCAELVTAGGFVAISQPGHAHGVQQIAERYEALQFEGTAGLVYLADNDETGRRRAEQAAEAAALAGLPLLVIRAGDLWPDLPEGGSIDDAPGTIAEQIATIETEARWLHAISTKAAPDAEQPGKGQGASAEHEAEAPPQDVPRDELIQQLLDQLLDLHLDPTAPWAKQQAIRAELWNLGVRGDAIDDRLLYALAERWGLPLQAGHTGARRGRSIADPLDSPAEDLLPGFLLWRRDHVLFGAGGSGKTMAAAGMGVAIIKGRPFLDQEIPPDRSGRILWIGSDGGEGARAMVREYLEDLGVADDPQVVEGFTVWTAEGGDGMPAWSCTPRGLMELRDELEGGGYALVVIDSLKAVLELAGINFGIGPVGTLMRFMQALVGRHCSLLWLHHPAGGKAAGKGLQAAAGSQNINQIPSAVHQLTRVITERGPVNEWTVHKLRGSQTREFSYRLGEEGFEITKGEITGNARAAILDCLQLREAGGMSSQTHLIVTELFGTSESTIRNNLTWLRKRGLVRKQATHWRLTGKGRKAIELISQGVASPWT